MKQESLFSHFDRGDLKLRYGRTVHGGSVRKRGRKLERPLAAGRPVHLVLKSARAKGAWSFLAPKNQAEIRSILTAKSRKFGVRIADFANVGDHLHLTIRFKSREGFQNFLRATTCLIARAITGAKKGNPVGSFWQGLAFTRVIRTRFEERLLKGYLQANRIEAGKGRAVREKFLNAFNDRIHRPTEAKKPPPKGSFKIDGVVVPPGRWVLLENNSVTRRGRGDL